MGYQHLFEHLKWSRKKFGKNVFSPWGPRWTHCWPSPLAGRAALRLHQVTIGIGV